MNYLVLGLPKSGTSAIHAAIKAALDPLSLFEPSRARQIEYLLAREAPHRLAKVMLPTYQELSIPEGSFHRTVLIVRDPRDVLVSWLLYRPLMTRNNGKEAFVDDLLAALERKEKDPRSASITSLFQILDRHQIPYTRKRGFRQQFDLVMKFDEEDENHFTIRYEDFVDGKTEALSDYLGIPVGPRARVGDHIAFNERSKTYGAWKNWFLEEDREAWSKPFQAFMHRYGYDQDWALADDPVIDPASSSAYIRRNLERLRRMPNVYGELKQKHYYTDGYLKLLESAISDGSEGALIEVALAHKYGWVLPRSRERFLALMSDAAERGNPVAMMHLGILHERGDGVAADAELSKELFARAVAIYGAARTQRTIARLRQRYPDADSPNIEGAA